MRERVGSPRALATACAALASVACGAPLLPAAPVEPGSYRVYLHERAGGYQRGYRIHVPAGLREGEPAPLVVALHGGGSSGRTLERRAGLNAAAARHGFLVAYPRGEGALGLFRHWNAGHCCATGKIQGRDDVGFVRRVIEDVAARLPIDRERIYLTGFSNGGMLAWRFAAEHADLVAGVAPIAATVAGAIESDDAEAARLPTPTRAVPMILLYGSDDRRVPPEEVEASLDHWAELGGCGEEPVERRLYDGRVRVSEWTTCDRTGPFVSYEIEGWGHRWPGPYFTGERDDGLRDFDAAEVLWRFFQRSRPSG